MIASGATPSATSASRCSTVLPEVALGGAKVRRGTSPHVSRAQAPISQSEQTQQCQAVPSSANARGGDRTPPRLHGAKHGAGPRPTDPGSTSAARVPRGSRRTVHVPKKSSSIRNSGAVDCGCSCARSNQRQTRPYAPGRAMRKEKHIAERLVRSPADRSGQGSGNVGANAKCSHVRRSSGERARSSECSRSVSGSTRGSTAARCGQRPPRAG